MIDVNAAGASSRGRWRGEIGATLALAWPLILTNVSQVALATTDVIMMGWLGPDALAAGALAVNLNFAFLIFAIGLVTATSPLIAIELGRKRHSVRDVRRTVRQGFWAAVAISIPVWAILWQAEPILLALGQEPHLAAEATSYVHTLQWSLLPALIFLVLRNFVSALERPLAALWIGGAAVVVNALLVWVLMFGRLGLPALGLPGAGIGTTITNIFLAAGLAGLVSLDRRFRRYHVFGRFWRPDWARFQQVWRIGLPIAATLAFEVTIFNGAAFLMGLISAEALAAHAIAVQIPSLAFMVPLGLGMAATVRVGLAFGARDTAAIARAGWTAYAISLVYACGTAAAMLFAGRPLVGLFLDLGKPENQAVIELAVIFLVFAGLFQFVDAAQAVASGVLRGLGDTRVPMILAGIGYWGVGLPLGVLLAFPGGFEGAGIWTGLATGLAVVAIMMTVRWVRREPLGLTRPRSAARAPAIEAAAAVPAIGPGPIV
ncbi:MAG: MATE family efflux transporter [Bauldia sp.]